MQTATPLLVIQCSTWRRMNVSSVAHVCVRPQWSAIHTSGPFRRNASTSEEEQLRIWSAVPDTKMVLVSNVGITSLTQR